MSAVLPSNEPPIQVIYATSLRAAIQVASLARVAFGVVIRIALVSSNILVWIYNAIVFILAPFLFFVSPLFYGLKLVYVTLVRAPYNFVVTASQHLEDVWAVIGIALLVGCIIGLMARGLARLTVRIILGLQGRAKEFSTKPMTVDVPQSPVPGRRSGVDDVGTSRRSMREVPDAAGGRGRVRRVEWRRV
jgi:hypothetical protein